MAREARRRRSNRDRTGGARCARLAEDAADDDGGQPVTGFRATASPGGATCDALGDASMCWIRDLEAVPIWDSRLGFVHAGFMMGMYDVLAAVALAAVKDIVVTGHSLGGARARILAALLAYSGKPVSQCCVFGSPRPGFANLSRILQKSATPLASYRNYHDPVPLVPAAWVPVIGDPWVHPDPWISLEEHSAPDDLEPLRDHHIQRYLDGLAKLG